MSGCVFVVWFLFYRVCLCLFNACLAYMMGLVFVGALLFLGQTRRVVVFFDRACLVLGGGCWYVFCGRFCERWGFFYGLCFIVVSALGFIGVAGMLGRVVLFSLCLWLVGVWFVMVLVT